jgi:hypothetical protein
VAQAAVGILLMAVLAWAVTRGLERIAGVQPEIDAPATAPDPVPTPIAHITATLFYGSSDGQALVPVRREVPLENGIVPQGRRILEAQLDAAPAPYISVIPEGATLRAFYVTDRGDAFVDLSPEASSNHPGGSTMELLTVYALVNVVVANLPDVQRVQLLVNGQEVDTLAGHVDLRRPLPGNRSLVREDAESQ